MPTNLEHFHNQNCRSFLGTARYWVDQRDWPRAIDNLKAAIRAANRAGNLRTSGMTLVAIRRCQDAQKYYAAMAADAA